MFFPVAGIEVSPWIPPAVAFLVSLLTSTGGISGAFLLLPFQVSVLGFDTPAVSATNQLYNIIAIPSGVCRYIQEGRMLWPLTWVVVLGTLPGVLMGAVLRVQYLPDPRHFKLFAGLVLLYMGIRLLRELLKKEPRHARQALAEKQFHRQVQGGRASGEVPASEGGAQVVIQRCDGFRIVYAFQGHTFQVPVWGVVALSFAVGIVGGVYGIGGGAILAPFFVSVYGLPVYTVAGAALMGTLVTSVAGVAFYQMLAPWYPDMAVAPDWALGFLFGIGGLAGMYCGARLQKFMPARRIRWIVAACVLFPAIRYIWAFVA